jgi:hypothetical protein
MARENVTCAFNVYEQHASAILGAGSPLDSSPRIHVSAEAQTPLLTNHHQTAGERPAVDLLERCRWFGGNDS